MGNLLDLMEHREPDITRNRHGGNAQSEAAHERIQGGLPRAAVRPHTLATPEFAAVSARSALGIFQTKSQRRG